MKMAAAGKTLEVREDPEDKRGRWRQNPLGMPGDAQGPWLMTSKAGNLEQLHDSNWRDFLPNAPRPAAIPLLKSEVKT